MDTILIPLDDLQPFNGNPRTIDEDGLTRLEASLRRFGLYVPLVVWDDPDGDRTKVIAGNQRLIALRRMRDRGEQVPDPVPVVVFDGPEDSARVLLLRDNNHDGDWDWSTLSGYLDDLVESGDLGESDLLLSGFGDELLRELSDFDPEPLIAATAPPRDEGINPTDSEPRVSATRDEPTPDPKPSTTLFSFGNVKGPITIPTYDGIVDAIDGRSKEIGTTDLDAVLGSLLDTVESNLQDLEAGERQ